MTYRHGRFLCVAIVGLATPALADVVAPVGKVLAIACLQPRPSVHATDVVARAMPAGRVLSPAKKARKQTKRRVKRSRRRRVMDRIIALRRRSQPRRAIDRELRRQYRQYQHNIRSCFLRAARRTSLRVTKTEVEMTIEADGAVNVVGFSPALPASLSGCLQMWLGRWKFSPDTEQAQVSFPVMFRPGAAI